jgi:hypothetical protein
LHVLTYTAIPRGAQHVTVHKYFSHTSLVFSFSFSTPPIKLKLVLVINARLLITTHLDQSNYLANQQQMLGFVVPFTSLSILCKNAEPRPFNP